MNIVSYLMHFLGRPYIWSGDGSGKCGGGFDCSGLVLEGLWALGLYDGKDTTAQGLHDSLVKKGWTYKIENRLFQESILFFGDNDKKITHVAVAVGDGLMIEAGGGGSKCKTPATSTGMVRVRPIRNDLVSALRRP